MLSNRTYVAHMVHIILQKTRQSQGLPQATLIVFIARQIIPHRDPSHRGGIGADLERWQVLMFPVWSSNTAIHFVCFISGSNLPSGSRRSLPDWRNRSGRGRRRRFRRTSFAIRPTFPSSPSLAPPSSHAVHSRQVLEI